MKDFKDYFCEGQMTIFDFINKKEDITNDMPKTIEELQDFLSKKFGIYPDVQKSFLNHSPILLMKKEKKKITFSFGKLRTPLNGKEEFISVRFDQGYSGFGCSSTTKEALIEMTQEALKHFNS